MARESHDLASKSTRTLEVKARATVSGIDAASIHRPGGQYGAGEAVSIGLGDVDPETCRQGLFLAVRSRKDGAE